MMQILTLKDISVYSKDRLCASVLYVQRREQAQECPMATHTHSKSTGGDQCLEVHSLVPGHAAIRLRITCRVDHGMPDNVHTASFSMVIVKK